MERFPFLATDGVRCGRVSWAQVPECSSGGGESELECSGNCKALIYGGNMAGGVLGVRGTQLSDPLLILRSWASDLKEVGAREVLEQRSQVITSRF